MLNREELLLVKDAIRDAERFTSAEIRVCVARRCSIDPFQAACRKFEKLKMYKTALRNSVLIYVAPDDNKVAIVGDSGITKITQPDFWSNSLSEMISFFKDKKICIGICLGVKKVGELMKELYPADSENPNELSDDVIFDESDEE